MPSSPAGTQPALAASTVERRIGIAAASPAATAGNRRAAASAALRASIPPTRRPRAGEGGVPSETAVGSAADPVAPSPPSRDRSAPASRGRTGHRGRRGSPIASSLPATARHDTSHFGASRRNTRATSTQSEHAPGRTPPRPHSPPTPTPPPSAAPTEANQAQPARPPEEPPQDGPARARPRRHHTAPPANKPPPPRHRPRPTTRSLRGRREEPPQDGPRRGPSEEAPQPLYFAVQPPSTRTSVPLT